MFAARDRTHVSRFITFFPKLRELIVTITELIDKRFHPEAEVTTYINEHNNVLSTFHGDGVVPRYATTRLTSSVQDC